MPFIEPILEFLSPMKDDSLIKISKSIIEVLGN